MNKLDEALTIAETYDVSTAKDCAVVYSVSFMPTDDNKKDAERFVKEGGISSEDYRTKLDEIAEDVDSGFDLKIHL